MYNLGSMQNMAGSHSIKIHTLLIFLMVFWACPRRNQPVETPDAAPNLEGTPTDSKILDAPIQLEARGSVKGRITKGKEPLAAAVVELCAQPALVFARTPCSDAVFVLETQTDIKGRFIFAEVPKGRYQFAIYTDNEWTQTMGDHRCQDVNSEQTLDIGTIQLP